MNKTIYLTKKLLSVASVFFLCGHIVADSSGTNYNDAPIMLVITNKDMIANNITASYGLSNTACIPNHATCAILEFERNGTQHRPVIQAYTTNSVDNKEGEITIGWYNDLTSTPPGRKYVHTTAAAYNLEVHQFQS